MAFTKVSLVLSLFFLFSPLATALSSADAEIREKAKLKLQGKGDFLTRKVKRIGNRTVTLEVFASMPANWQATPGILTDFDSYPSWVFEGINRRPEGGEYYTQVRSLKREKETPGMLIAHLAFKLPLFKKDLKRRFLMSSQTKENVLTINGKILPLEDSIVPNAEGVLKVFPVGRDRVWVYSKAWIKLKPWLLYQALPERLLQSETGERLRIILDNYTKEETRRRKERIKKQASRKASNRVESP